MPTQKVTALMKDFAEKKRTLHHEFYPPSQRLQQYRRKELQEEKQEHEVERLRLEDQQRKQKEQMVGSSRDEMLTQWTYDYQAPELSAFDKETLEFELKQKIKKCKKKKKKKKKKKTKKAGEKTEPPSTTPDYVPFSVENQYFKTLKGDMLAQEGVFSEKGNYNEYQASEAPWEQKMKQRWLANRNVEIQNKRLEEEMTGRMEEWKENKRIRNEEFQRRLENNYMAS